MGNPNNELNELEKQISQIKPGDELDFYIKNAYDNFPFFLKALTRHNSNAYTYFGDVQKNLFYISDNMRDDFGFESNLVVNFLDKWRDRIQGEKWKKAYDKDHEQMIENKSTIHDMHYKVKDKNGEVFWIRCCGEMEWDKTNTKPLYFAGRVSRQSDTFIVDPVTSFPIIDTLQRYLKSKADSGMEIWAIGFCFNHMSKINTLQGNTFADRLIHETAKALTEELGNYVTFYRLPGVRCLALPDEEIDKDFLLNKIREIVGKKYKEAGLIVDVPCSFVAMKFPQPNWTTEEFIENMVALIKFAHHEKSNECIEDIDENIKKIRAMSNMSMTITKNVLKNMENFRAVVQPIVSAETGKIIGGETLMRWKYNDQNISPAVFIPILERDRMIQIAGRWILEEAVKACSKIVKVQPDFYLTVNVSLHQLYDDEFMPCITSVLEKYKLDGKHIVLEMTESGLDSNPKKVLELVVLCRKLGIRLALDDFGTGYSSMRVLLKYPMDIIKIDRSLLLEMEESMGKNGFIASLIQACHKFGKKICVEGVENEHQKALVQQGHADMIQGFLFYRPTELPELFNIMGVED